MVDTSQELFRIVVDSGRKIVDIKKQLPNTTGNIIPQTSTGQPLPGIAIPKGPPDGNETK